MGWLYCANTKDELIDRLTAKGRFPETTKIIARRVVGNNHWYVGEVEGGKRFIGLDKMECNRSSEYLKWGYKDMDESMGPYEYNVPLSFLKLAPYDEEFSGHHSKVWREHVEQYHARKAEQKANRDKLEVGKTIELHGNFYTLIEKRGYSWVAHKIDAGLFKLTPRSLKFAKLV